MSFKHIIVFYVAIALNSCFKHERPFLASLERFALTWLALRREREREKGKKTSIEQLFLSCKYCLAPGPLLAPHSFLCFEILPPLEDHLQGSRLVHNAKLVSAIK